MSRWPTSTRWPGENSWAPFEACNQTGATVLYSSHAVAELERICDYLIVLRGGHVRVAGDIDELRQQHRVIAGPAGWPDSGGWQIISQRSAAGRAACSLFAPRAHRVEERFQFGL